MRSSLTSLLLLLLLTLTSSQNYRPIIGLLTTPSDYASFPSSSYNYLRASVAKWVQSGGCRVTLLPYTNSQSDLKSQLDSLNGVVLPGGYTPSYSGSTPTAYQLTVNYILAYAASQSLSGIYYPVFGINNGALAIAAYFAGTGDVITSFNIQNVLLPLQAFGGTQNSILYASLGDWFGYLQSNAVTYFNNTLGLSPTAWSNTGLNDNLNILTTSTANGDAFVSSFEHKTLPVFGVLYHPEKNAFEWDQQLYPKTYQAIQSLQLIINQFIDGARGNSNSFPTPTIEDNCLIYNSTITMFESTFAQFYFLSNSATACTAVSA